MNGGRHRRSGASSWLATSLLLGALSTSAAAQVDIGGVVYDGMGGPLLADTVYHVVDTVDVPAGRTLTVQSGAILKVLVGDHRVDVNGTLRVEGRPEAAVVVTSILDDTAGGDTGADGPTTGGPGDWEGLFFDATSSGSVIEHAEVRFGGRNSVSSIELRNALDLTLRAVTVEDGADHGVDVRMSATELVVENCRFLGNGRRSVDHLFTWQLEGFRHNFAAGNAIADVTLVQNGTLDRDVRIGPENLIGDVLYLTDTCTVPAGTTLTLAAGVVVKLDDAPVGIDVAGTLVVEGTGAAPVVFTSILDDAYGGDSELDGPTSGAPGDWGGILLRPGASACVVEHALVRYAGRNGLAGVDVASGGAELRATRVEHGAGDGFDLTGLTAPADNLVAFSNAGAGVRLAGGSFDLRHATASTNSGGGVSATAAFTGEVVNGIAWGNVPTNFSGLAAGALRHSDGDPASAGLDGNIFADPSFVDPSAAVGDLRLGAASPCTDAGDDTVALSVVTDHAEASRLLDPTTSGVLHADMGAYERGRFGLTVAGTFVLGGTVDVSVEGPPGTAQVLLGGLDGVQLVTPFGYVTAGDRSLVVLPPVAVGATTRLRLPPTPALLGTSIGIQAQVFDAGDPTTGEITRLVRAETRPPAPGTARRTL